MPILTFKRYEFKYLLNETKYKKVTETVRNRLREDEYGRKTIQSLYYDTKDNRLIRASLEKPVYKEKLRLRCYGLNDGESDVFLEMKRKYDGIVYKRRIKVSENCTEKYFSGTGKYNTDMSQIENEILYFTSFYGNLLPKILILYDRAAYYDTDSDLRITFDENIRYRTNDLNLHTSLDGKRLMNDGYVLMEIKTGFAYPLWVSDMISREEIIKTSFSKYGEAYKRELEKNKNDNNIILEEEKCLKQSILTVI